MCCRAENTNALPCGDTFVRFACWFLCTRKDKAVGEQIDVFIVQVDENNFLLTPPRIVMTVSVCLSVREHKSGITRPMLTEFFVHVTYVRGSVLLWRRCDMLCTSGFMDDAWDRPRGGDSVGSGMDLTQWRILKVTHHSTREQHWTGGGF